jgi:hypothetical protein
MGYQTLTLVDWSLIGTGFDPVSPDAPLIRMRGKVYCRPMYRNGDVIHTPEVEKVWMAAQPMVRINGLVYVLGAIDAEYEARHSNVLNKLLRRFP